MSNYYPFSIPPLTPLEQGDLAAAAITASYQQLIEFGDPAVQIIVISTLDDTVQLSLDGVTDFIPCPGDTNIVLDLRLVGGCIQGNRGVFVKTLGTPTAGSIYATALVAKTG